MKKLIVVADDFGLCRSVNEGILRAATEGIVTEISLQLNYPGTDHAVALIGQHELSNIGLHLLLNNWKKTGKLYHREDYICLFRESSVQEIQKLAKEEFSLFEKRIGRKPTHIIPQKGIHGNLKVLESVIEYAKQCNIPVRIPRTDITGSFSDENYAAEVMMKRNNIKTTDYMFAHVIDTDIERAKASFLEDLQNIEDGKTAEFMFHPGYVDKELLPYTSLRYERARDLALCIDPRFRKAIEKMNFIFCSYSEV